MSARLRPAALRALALALACALSALCADGAAAQDLGSRVRWERPPEGTLESGAISAPAWAVALVAGLVVIGAAGVLAFATLRARRARGARARGSEKRP
jgi:hypothetical protein